MITLNTNLKTALATTQFTNYEFSSFCNFNGKSLASRQDGLFELGGNSDNGAPIEAYFEPAKSTYGSMHAKRCRYMYFELLSSGPLQLSIGSGFSAPVVPQQFNTTSYVRVTLPKNLVHVYWAYKLSNIGGHDFTVNSVDALFIKRNLGHSRQV